MLNRKLQKKILIDDQKLKVHYQNGVDDAKQGFKPSWFHEEATEWKSAERDAYRAGYRTANKDA